MTTSTVVAPQRIDAGGIETSYLEVGSGEPVIMLHGSGPGVSALANWQHNIPTLAQRFHVLAPDIVGFGATERPDDLTSSLRPWTDHRPARPDHQDGPDGRTGCRHDIHRRSCRAARL
jgi:2-hydroxymuconate-semialdehyde hydrolase/2-hydroxy-6-oxo-octa-2,4-dienoate hydrolase